MLILSIWLFFITQFNSPHFIIEHPHNISTTDRDVIIGYLENKYSELENNWGLKVTDKIKINISPTVYDFVKKTHYSKEIGGLYYNGKIYLQPIPVLKRRGVLNSILSHELAHAFLNEYSKNGLPIWLNESFAVYFSNDISRLAKIGHLSLKHFDDLERLLKTENKRKNDVYFYLGLTMQFFIDTYQQQKVALLLRSYNGINREKVFPSVLDEPVEQIEIKWKKYLERF
jgi:hypothetical protein